MARVNTITKEAADKIAAMYFKNESVHALYVTRDGQVFYADKAHYLKIHERANNLEKSWFYSKGQSSQKEVVEVVEDNPQETKEPMSFNSLKKHFQDLTKEGKIEESEWSDLKFAQLRKLYENNKETK